MTRRATWTAVGATWAAVAVGLALRLPLLGRSVTSDELAALDPSPWASLLWGDESAVNPPLWRALLRLAPAADGVALGRDLALIAGLAAILGAGALGARAGRSLGAGALAAWLVALDFQAVRVSAEARAYPLAMLALAVWLGALVRLVDGEGGRGARVRLAVAAAALPWLHYATVPVLGAVLVALAAVPRWRPLLRGHAPAALLALPLLPAVLADSKARVATPGDLGDSVAAVVSLGQRWPWRLDATPGDPTGPAVVTALAVGLVVAAWPRLPDRLRLLAVAAAASLAAPAALGVVQYVRPPVGALAAVPVVALLAAATAALPAGRALAGAALLAWFGLGTVAPLRSWAASDAFVAVDVLAATWREAPPAPVWHLAPSSAVNGLVWRETGTTLKGARRDPACPSGAPCAVIDGTRFVALARDATPAAVGGRVAVVGPVRVDTAGCATVSEGRGLVVLDCPAVGSAPAP